MPIYNKRLGQMRSQITFIACLSLLGRASATSKFFSVLSAANSLIDKLDTQSAPVIGCSGTSTASGNKRNNLEAIFNTDFEYEGPVSSGIAKKGSARFGLLEVSEEGRTPAESASNAAVTFAISTTYIQTAYQIDILRGDSGLSALQPTLEYYAQSTLASIGGGGGSSGGTRKKKFIVLVNNYEDSIAPKKVSEQMVREELQTIWSNVLKSFGGGGSTIGGGKSPPSKLNDLLEIDIVHLPVPPGKAYDAALLSLRQQITKSIAVAAAAPTKRQAMQALGEASHWSKSVQRLHSTLQVPNTLGATILGAITSPLPSTVASALYAAPSTAAAAGKETRDVQAIYQCAEAARAALRAAEPAIQALASSLAAEAAETRKAADTTAFSDKLVDENEYDDFAALCSSILDGAEAEFQRQLPVEPSAGGSTGTTSSSTTSSPPAYLAPYILRQRRYVRDALLIRMEPFLDRRIRELQTECIKRFDAGVRVATRSMASLARGIDVGIGSADQYFANRVKRLVPRQSPRFAHLGQDREELRHRCRDLGAEYLSQLRARGADISPVSRPPVGFAVHVLLPDPLGYEQVRPPSRYRTRLSPRRKRRTEYVRYQNEEDIHFKPRAHQPDLLLLEATPAKGGIQDGQLMSPFGLSLPATTSQEVRDLSDYFFTDAPVFAEDFRPGKGNILDD